MKKKLSGLFSGFVLFVTFAVFQPIAPLDSDAEIVLATALLMATWWLTEAISIHATALIPLVAFPLGGILPARDVAVNYMDPNIVLFMGGFFLAMAIQKWDLHRRIALTIINLLGTNQRRLVLGFMVATGFLSMWVSNTATAMMIYPIATAVILQLQDQGLPEQSGLPMVLLLGIAYAANIGGTATLIGTPPNLVFAGQFPKLFPEQQAITFSRWFLLGFPFACVFLGVCWVYLTRIYSSLKTSLELEAGGLFEEKLEKLGPMGRGEKGVALVFGLTALAWIFRSSIRIGSFVIPGWAPALGVSGSVHDSTVAVLAALVLFVTPVNWEEGEFLLDWDWAKKIPWGVLLLFGGGIALASGFESSGLSKWVASWLNLLHGIPILLMILSVCLMMTFLTELTSNTATTAIFLPILASAATSLSLAPELMMIPATLSASCAFMLPVATPPNAIVFGSDRLSIPEMARAGIWLNFLGVVLVTISAYTLLGVAFGVVY